MVEQPVVCRRRGVMELVDNENIECVRGDLLQSRLLQRLDHREDVPSFGDPAPTVDLSKRAVAEDGPVGRQRLPEDLLAMGNEQQRQVAMPVDKLPVIERSDDSLACPGRGNHEISVTVVPLALDCQRVQHPLLVWVRPHVKTRE